MAAHFSKTVSGGARIYYIDSREDKKGQQYITISEMARDGKRRTSVYLYPEHFGAFAEALNECASFAAAQNVKKR